MVRAQVVDAFVLGWTPIPAIPPDWLDEAGVPYAASVALWGRDDITSWADVDGAAGLADATAHLLDAGYERIGYLGWPRLGRR